ncbi:hypothetical protein DIPPA_29487 [Diplonema papillatum]|nr:hypothetical protein DIPPA_29487 [Diplonema papillatum]
MLLRHSYSVDGKGASLGRDDGGHAAARPRRCGGAPGEAVRSSYAGGDGAPEAEADGCWPASKGAALGPAGRSRYGGDWMGSPLHSGIDPGASVRSSLERAAREDLEKSWEKWDDTRMSTLDALEKRLGDTSAGLTRLHQLLETVSTGETGRQETLETCVQARVLSESLIRNHMETYTSVSSLRSALTDISSDPVNTLVPALKTIVGLDALPRAYLRGFNPVHSIIPAVPAPEPLATLTPTTPAAAPFPVAACGARELASPVARPLTASSAGSSCYWRSPGGAGCVRGDGSVSGGGDDWTKRSDTDTVVHTAGADEPRRRPGDAAPDGEFRSPLANGGRDGWPRAAPAAVAGGFTPLTLDTLRLTVQAFVARGPEEAQGGVYQQAHALLSELQKVAGFEPGMSAELDGPRGTPSAESSPSSRRSSSASRPDARQAAPLAAAADNGLVQQAPAVPSGQRDFRLVCAEFPIATVSAGSGSGDTGSCLSTSSRPSLSSSSASSSSLARFPGEAHAVETPRWNPRGAATDLLSLKAAAATANLAPLANPCTKPHDLIMTPRSSLRSKRAGPPSPVLLPASTLDATSSLRPYSPRPPSPKKDQPPPAANPCGPAAGLAAASAALSVASCAARGAQPKKHLCVGKGEDGPTCCSAGATHYHGPGLLVDPGCERSDNKERSAFLVDDDKADLPAGDPGTPPPAARLLSDYAGSPHNAARRLGEHPAGADGGRPKPSEAPADADAAGSSKRRWSQAFSQALLARSRGAEPAGGPPPPAPEPAAGPGAPPQPTAHRPLQGARRSEEGGGWDAGCGAAAVLLLPHAHGTGEWGPGALKQGPPAAGGVRAASFRLPGNHPRKPADRDGSSTTAAVPASALPDVALPAGQKCVRASVLLDPLPAGDTTPTSAPRSRKRRVVGARPTST